MQYLFSTKKDVFHFMNGVIQDLKDTYGSENIALQQEVKAYYDYYTLQIFKPVRYLDIYENLSEIIDRFAEIDLHITKCELSLAFDSNYIDKNPTYDSIYDKKLFPYKGVLPIGGQKNSIYQIKLWFRIGEDFNKKYLQK